MHDFETSKLKAKEDEKRLDEHYAVSYKVQETTKELDIKGIDRFFMNELGVVYGVEYKCDYVSADTGNAFLETEIYYNPETKLNKRLGWALKLMANWLIYFDVGNSTAYKLDALKLKNYMPMILASEAGNFKDGIENIDDRKSPPQKYYAGGYVVPLAWLQSQFGIQDPVKVS